MPKRVYMKLGKMPLLTWSQRWWTFLISILILIDDTVVIPITLEYSNFWTFDELKNVYVNIRCDMKAMKARAVCLSI